MFCPNCGANINDNDCFCEKCGTRIVEPDRNSSIANEPIQNPEPMDVPVQAAQPSPVFVQPSMSQPPLVQPKKSGSGKKTVLIISIILIVVLIIAALVGGLLFLKKQYSPQKKAEEFAVLMINGEWENVYDEINLEQTDLVNKDNFVQMCKTDNSAFGVNLDSVKDYAVVCNKGSNGSYKCDVTLHYSKGSDQTLSYMLVVDKDGFLFFDTYKIEFSESPIVNYKIYAPQDSTVTINGVEGEYVAPENEEGYGSYDFNTILPGEYELVVAHENCEDYTADITVYSNAALNENKQSGYQEEYYELTYGDYDYESGEIVNGCYDDNEYYVSLYFVDEYEKELTGKIDTMSKTIISDVVADKFDASAYSFDTPETQDYVLKNIYEYIEVIYEDYIDYSYDTPVLEYCEKDTAASNPIIYLPYYGYTYYYDEHEASVYTDWTYSYGGYTDAGTDWFYSEFCFTYYIDKDGKIIISNLSILTDYV